MIDVLEYLNHNLKPNSSRMLVSEESDGMSNKTIQKLGMVPKSKGNIETNKDAGKKEVVKAPLVYENSIDAIIVQLHKIATEKSKGSNFKLVNSAFDDPDNPTKLVSTGEHVITVLPINPDKPLTQEESTTIIKTYVQWFIGPDASKKITKKTVYPIIDDENTAYDDKQEAKEKDKKISDKAKEHEKQLNSESLLPKLAKLILEETPSDLKNQEEKEDKISNDEDDPEKAKELRQNKSTDAVDSKLTHSKGFYTIYQLNSIPGKKDTTLADVTKKFAKSVFRNIAGFNWLAGGSTGKTVGEIIDDVDSIFGNMDPEELKSNVYKELGKKMPGFHPEVSVYDSKTILNHCSKILDKKDKLKIQPVKFSLCIRLNDNDTGMEKTRNQIIKRNLKTIADCVNKAISGFVKRVKFHIKPEHIIATHDVESRDKVEIEYERKQISNMLKKIKDSKLEDELKKWDEDAHKTAIAANKENSLQDLQICSKRLKKFIEMKSINDSLIDQIVGKLIVEEPETKSEERQEGTKNDSEATEQQKNAITVEQVKNKAIELAKKTFDKDDEYEVDVLSSTDVNSEIFGKQYGSSEKIDQNKFSNALVFEIKNIIQKTVKGESIFNKSVTNLLESKDYTKKDLDTTIREVFNGLEIKETGDVIEVEKEVESSKQKNGKKTTLIQSKVNSFENLYDFLFEADQKEENGQKEISKEELEDIRKEFAKLASSKLPRHDVDAKVEESQKIIDELKKNKVGNNELYGKLKDSKYIFSICAKAKNALKESFSNFALDVIDLILEVKTKSKKEQFIRKLAHAISIKPDFIDSEKDRLGKLDVDPKIKEYLSGKCKDDIKNGQLDKDTKFFDQMHNDKAFKNATDELDKIINSTEEKKVEDSEVQKKEEEKKAEEKATREEAKSEVDKFKRKLEEILKKNPKFFEKYKDEIEKSNFNKKIKAYLQNNIKDDYDGEHLKTTAFLKKNITDEELKDSFEKLSKFYDEYSNSYEGKAEREEIDNSKEDAKLSLQNNLDDKVIKAIFDEILEKFPKNIIAVSQDFYIVNSDVDEKKEITKINAEWSTTYSHDNQKRDTHDNGTVKKEEDEEVVNDSFQTNLADMICEDLNFDIFLLERTEFHHGQLSKDKVAYKQKIEAGLKRIDEVVPKEKFSKILDVAIRQYKDKFSRNYDKHVKSGNLKTALLDPKKFTDSMYNDFTRGELFAITVILRVILYAYYFTSVGSYALMPANLVGKPDEKEEVNEKMKQKAIIAPFNLQKEDKPPVPPKPENDEKSKEEIKEKYNFFIIPMKGLDYKDSDDERMSSQK